MWLSSMSRKGLRKTEMKADALAEAERVAAITEQERIEGCNNRGGGEFFLKVKWLVAKWIGTRKPSFSGRRNIALI